jgi:phospholipase C
MRDPETLATVTRRRAAIGALIALTSGAFSAPSQMVLAAPASATPIKHIVIIMQEKASCDHYFGTYPGADGPPMVNGVFSACVPDPALKKCIAPFHNRFQINFGGPVSQSASVADVHGGAMDGFIATAEQNSANWVAGTCGDPDNRACNIDVMGYRDAREIPNYWSYAENFVLQDHMYGAVTAHGLPAHLQMLSGWSASCTSIRPSSCASSLSPLNAKTPNSWTDITYLLQKAGVSWGYYVFEPASGPAPCGITPAHVYTPYMWNPLPCFVTVQTDGQSGNIQDQTAFAAQAAAGTLPAVSWLAPNWFNGEHQTARLAAGQQYVTNAINAVMLGPNWSSTAIFLVWADWGGYYDHEPPLAVDAQGYGIRVPGLVISPYARRGYVDHQVLSTDAYLKFIEDLFLNGQRLDPQTDGRPDPRPTVRENVAVLGDLMNDFDFSQTPRPPLVLSPTAPNR